MTKTGPKPALLETCLDLTPAQISAYREQGFIRIADLLQADLLAIYRAEVTRVIRGIKPTTTTGTYGRAFTQRMNLWRQSELIARLVRSKRLAQLAADLMGVARVRLYHDQALYKEAGGGHTPWHADQFYWPLSNDNTITAWIPLQAVSQAMGPLCFAPGSHLTMKNIAKDLSISDDSEALLAHHLAGSEVVDAPFDLGEVSFHSGWTCHRAGPNDTDTTRAVFTIIYMDSDMRMIEPAHHNHTQDARTWLPGVQPGESAASPINPLL